MSGIPFYALKPGDWCEVMRPDATRLHQFAEDYGDFARMACKRIFASHDLVGVETPTPDKFCQRCAKRAS